MISPNSLKIAVRGSVENPGEPITVFVTDKELVSALAKAVGFSYKLIPTEDGFGSRLANGSWTGMLGMLQNQKVDIVVSTVEITEERNEDFLFTYPFISSEVSYATRKPEYSPDMFAVLHPFSTHMWLAVIICLCIMPFLFRALLRKKYPAMDLVMSVLGSILLQGTNFQPRKIREHLLLSFWFLGAGFVCYIYSAVLLSFITFPALKGIRTIPDLSDGIMKGEYQCRAFRTFIGTELLRSNEPSLRIIGQSLQDGETTPYFYEFLEDSTNERLPVFIDMQMFLRRFQDFYFLSEDVFFTMFPAFVMRKDFCCKSELDEVIHRFWASGVSQKIISESHFRLFLLIKDELSQKNEDLFRKLNLADFKGAFLLLTTSQLFAAFVLMAEIVFKKFEKMNFL